MKSIVIKIGSNIITAENGLNESRITAIARAVTEAWSMGYRIALVSSGAIAAGRKKLDFRPGKIDIKLKQAAAAVGQSSLIRLYEKKFAQFGRKVAQILITRDAFEDRRRYINARNTLLTLFELGVVPVINENDTVSIDEIKFGDNDQLASLVTGLIGAERLFILSDVDGLYSDDPKTNRNAVLIPVVEKIRKDITEMAKGSTSSAGTGGMFSKISAAARASEYGAYVHILNGRKPGAVISILRGEPFGTVIKPNESRLNSRKGWIAHGIKAKGELLLDKGAAEALLLRNRSLLPSGIVGIRGNFGAGDAVYCMEPSGKKIAKGLANYSSHDLEKIKGRKSSEIERVLGYRYSDEAIHKDNLVTIE